MTLPPLPKSFIQSDLNAVGFEGWSTWDRLRSNGFSDVPDGPAVYVVYRTHTTPPVFLETNPGGRFKDRDPSVPAETLAQNWIPGAHVLYIGKADAAARRVKQFARFGAGEPVGHWGGRLLWQLADSDATLLAWHPITWPETAREYEKRLLAHFELLNGGSMPYANLSH